MKIEHKIVKSLDTDLVTPEAMLTFWKYSIADYNFNDERTIRCMEVVIRAIKTGLMKDEVIKTQAKILDKIMNKVTKVIANIENHLESNSKFDSDLYCINLSDMFDVSNDKLYFPIIQCLDELTHMRNLEITNDRNRKEIYVYGWHRAEYFNNKFTQNKINSLCKDAATMMKIEKHIKNAKVENDGKRHIQITDEMPASKINVCAHFLDMLYCDRDTFVEVYNHSR